MEKACRDCSVVFPVDAEFYTERGLSVPNRCPWCRAARRAARITGTVDFYNAKGFGFIVADDGRRFFFDDTDLGSDWRVACQGASVSFMPEAGHPNPRARRVQVIEAGERA